MDERTKQAIKRKKPDLIYDCKEYRIEKIPLNYRVTVKWRVKKKISNHGIDRDFYAPPSWSLDRVKEMAEATIDEHFVR